MYRRQQQHYKQPTIRTFMLFCLLNFWLFSPSLILMGKCFQQKFKYVFTFFCSSNLLFPFHPNFQSFLAVLFLFFFTQNVKFLSRWFHLYVWDVWGVFFFFFLATLSQNSRTGPITFEDINWKVCNSRYITESCSLRSWKNQDLLQGGLVPFKF